MRAGILTPWRPGAIGDTGIPFEPSVFCDVPLSDGDWNIVTSGYNAANMPPLGNVVTIEVNVSDAVIAAVKADSRYGAASVLWEGDPDNSPIMTATAYNALVTFLANKLNATTTQVRNVLTNIGCVVDGVLTRYDFALKIIAYLRNRPRA